MPINKVPNNLSEKNFIKKGPKKKPLQLKEEQDVLTQTNTTQDLKNLEQDMNITQQKKALNQMYFSVREQTEQTKNGFGDGNYDHSITLSQLKAYFAEYHLTTTDFESIFDDILDDYDFLLKKFTSKCPKVENIIRRIKENRLIRQRKQTKRESTTDDIGNNTDNQGDDGFFLSPWQERQKAVVCEVFATLELPQHVDNMQVEQVFFNQFEQLQYCLQHINNLEDGEKEKFLKFLERLIALFFEGKLLEIYEITVDENGNIVIRGKGADGQMKTLYIKPEIVGMKNFSILQQHFFEARRKLDAWIQRKIALQEPIPTHIDIIWRKYVQAQIIANKIPNQNITQ